MTSWEELLSLIVIVPSLLAEVLGSPCGQANTHRAARGSSESSRVHERRHQGVGFKRLTLDQAIATPGQTRRALPNVGHGRLADGEFDVIAILAPSRTVPFRNASARPGTIRVKKCATTSSSTFGAGRWSPQSVEAVLRELPTWEKRLRERRVDAALHYPGQNYSAANLLDGDWGAAYAAVGVTHRTIE